MEEQCGPECEVAHGAHGMHRGGCSCSCHTCGAETCPGCAGMHGGKGAVDPVEIASAMWKRAFFEAMMEVHKEKLKKKIEAAWGPVMDKSADAVIESMGKIWQSMNLQASADQELREKIARIMSEAQKQR